jgi:hypothetical protein
LKNYISSSGTKIMGRHLHTFQQQKKSNLSYLKNDKNLKKFFSVQWIHRNISISICLLLASPQKHKAQSIAAFLRKFHIETYCIR